MAETNPGVDERYEDRPRTLLHPPSVFFLALVVGYGLRLVLGGRLPVPRAFAEGVGGLLILISMGILSASISSFAAGGEQLKPSTPSRQLFVAGPYRYSRNPIYLAMMLFGAGFGVATANSWIILTTALTGLLLHFCVIRPEERYLEDRFGEEYRAYKDKVRRWI